MAHTPTKRSYEALLSLFSYNTTGRIGAYDFQDLIASTFTGNTPVEHDGTGSYAIDLGESVCHILTLSGNTTLSFTNPVAGRVYNIIIKALTYSLAFPTMLWVDGKEGDVTANGTDLLTILYDGTDYLAYIHNQYVEPETKTLTLSYPNGGETIYYGDVCNITWNSTNIDNLRILYSTNNGTSWTEIISSVDATLGTYAFIFPESAESTLCLVKLICVEDVSVYDTSDSVFTIAENVVSHNWVSVAPGLNSQTKILSLCEFNSKLYGGTYPGGRLFRWNNTDAWTQVADQLSSQTSIYALCVFNGKLYAGTAPNGYLFEWDGVSAWTKVADQLNSQTSIRCLCVFNSKLYGGTGAGGRLFEWNGTDAWTQVAPLLNNQYYVNSLCVFESELYGCTGGNGCLFKWNGTDAWTQVAPQLNSQVYINKIFEYNSLLYGSTGTGGRLFEWNGTDAWTQVAPQKNTQSYVWDLLEYNSELYGSSGGTTDNGGYLFKWGHE